MTSQVELSHVSKHYGGTVAVEDVSLEVVPGELVALLGPSGCGKTTTLRMIAGFVRPTSGAIRIGGRDMTALPPHRRNTGMVFQSYALFPHLSVAENIAFGLKRRRAPKEEIRRRVDEIVAVLRLQGLEQRLPRQLSGGQQQRVAVGRALVINPAVLLLDEPFSNLDAQLRAHVRDEVDAVLRETRTPAIFVTHDREEALSLADRVGVMVAGRIRQVGTPFDVYAHPVDATVARLVGEAAVVAGVARDGVVGTPLGPIPAPGTPDGPCDVVLRPERLRVRADAGGTSRVVHVTFYGDHQSVRCTLPDGTVVEVRVADPRPELVPGAAIVVEPEGPPVAVTAGSGAPPDAALS
jgi:ABC-type Fe3+/spermidine/putrescine transport system ATPase subunit